MLLSNAGHKKKSYHETAAITVLPALHLGRDFLWGPFNEDYPVVRMHETHAVTGIAWKHPRTLRLL